MTTNIYYLCRPDEKPVRRMDNPYGKNVRVQVNGTNYYEARARALRHAAEHGAQVALIVVGHCRTVRMLREGPHPYAAPSAYDDHGLLLYVHRLMGEHAGAVQIPSVGAVKQIPHGWVEQVPVVPMVVAYSVPAVMAVKHDDAGLGYNLVSHGFRVLTLGDYAYEQFGADVMDDYGSTSKWKRAYDAFLKTFF